MGLTMSRAVKRLFGNRKMKIVMVGLPGVGKTTILEKLRLGKIERSTVNGLKVKTTTYRNVSFIVFDIQGTDKIPWIWRHYFQEAQGLIFVVDCSDIGKFQEAKEVLHRICKEVSELKDACVLILANKQDLPNAISIDREIRVKFDLNNIPQRLWFVQGTCAIFGHGLYEGLDWLSHSI